MDKKTYFKIMKNLIVDDKQFADFVDEFLDNYFKVITVDDLK